MGASEVQEMQTAETWWSQGRLLEERRLELNSDGKVKAAKAERRGGDAFLLDKKILC